MKKEKPKANPVGRPPLIDETIVLKLEQAFSIGCNILQACAYSEISPQTYYEYLKKNPEFANRAQALRERPILKARKTIFDNLNDPTNARWYLERKQRDEFGSNVAPLEASFNDEAGKPLFQITLTPPKEPETD